ncbi:uncharacterized protein [Nicotiana sylvestris]
MSRNIDTLNLHQKAKRNAEERIADRNLRRRTRYAQMSPERKQLFLSQLRDKRAESKKQTLLQQSSNIIVSSVEVDSQPRKQSALTISNPSLHLQEGTSGDINNVNLHQKTKRNAEERIPDRNLCRRTRYAQMSPERKQWFLSQLRDKRAESIKQRLLQHSSTTVSSLEVDCRHQKGSALTITNPSLHLQEAGTSGNINNVNLPQKAKRNAEERIADRNLRRHTRYEQMSPERKQLFLSQLRDKRAELKKQRVLQHSSNTVSSLEVDIRPQKRSGLTITNPLSHLQEGHVSVATNTLLASNKGKRILDYFSIFEIGSTSGTYDDDAAENTFNFQSYFKERYVSIY